MAVMLNVGLRAANKKTRRKKMMKKQQQLRKTFLPLKEL